MSIQFKYASIPPEYASSPDWPQSGNLKPAVSSTIKGYQVIRQGAAVMSLNHAATFRLTGPEAGDYVNSLITNEIPALPGQGCYAALLNNKGKPVADFLVYRESETSLLVVAPDFLHDSLFETLDMYLVMRECELIDLTGRMSRMHLSGPSTFEILAEMFGLEQLKSSLTSVPYTFAPFIHPDLGTVQVSFNPAYGSSGFDVWQEHENLNDTTGEPFLHTSANTVPVESWEMARVEAGFPRFGIDIRPEHNWLEWDQKHGIHLFKGCYLGQESVAMAHFRGRPPRLLRGLIFQQEPDPNEKLESGGKSVGHVSSVVWSPARDAWIGLGYIQTRHLDAGGELTLGGISAEITPLPFIWADHVPDPRAISQASNQAAGAHVGNSNPL